MTTEALPAVTASARSVFGSALPLAQRYAALLADAGTVRGAIGPREVPRLWERHLVSCALLTELVEPDSRVLDVGSGAGLPGLAMAIRRPDLRVDLLEPMQRRVVLLEEAVALLGLGDRVRVHRGRADDPDVVDALAGADRVTARALAPLDRLVTWCLPLVAGDGALLALKGRSAAAEIRSSRSAVRRAGGTTPELVLVQGAGRVTGDPTEEFTSGASADREGVVTVVDASDATAGNADDHDDVVRVVVVRHASRLGRLTVTS